MRVDRRTFLGSLSALVISLPARAEQKKAASPAEPRLLEARPGRVRIEPKTETGIWGYNGVVPGPLLRVRKGEELRVKLVNKLDQPTSLSWHGVRIDNAMDGVAGLTQKPVLPGESFEYRFTPPDAGFFWYHPHVWPVSAEQQGRGLYGLLIVDDPEQPKVDEEILVVLDDWSLDERGEIQGGFLDKAQANGEGRIGDLVTVDAKPIPAAMSGRPGARLRLRMLNACSARVAVVSFVDIAATVIAIDGQPSELFQPARGTIPIAPGSRFEVIVDLPPEKGKQASLVLRGDADPDRSIVVFKTAGTPLPARPPVEKLAANPLLPTRIPLEKALKRDLVITGGDKPLAPPEPSERPEPKRKGRKAKAANGTKVAEAGLPPLPEKPQEPPPGLQPFWSLDGVASDGYSGKPVFSVPRGSAVSLAFVNRTAFPQQMHIHGHAMRLLHDLDDGWDPYWRDSVLLAPGKTKHVAFVADNPGKWAIESLILDRQVTGLAAWFEVT